LALHLAVSANLAGPVGGPAGGFANLEVTRLECDIGSVFPSWSLLYSVVKCQDTHARIGSGITCEHPPSPG
jgi:hypothetical protein